jgi:hypothetical protein
MWTMWTRWTICAVHGVRQVYNVDLAHRAPDGRRRPLFAPG